MRNTNSGGVDVWGLMVGEQDAFLIYRVCRALVLGLLISFVVFLLVNDGFLGEISVKLTTIKVTLTLRMKLPDQCD